MTTKYNTSKHRAKSASHLENAAAHQAPSAPVGVVERYLDEADMHKIFHLGSHVDRFSTQIGLLEKDDINDELNLKLQQETLQRLQAEFSVRRQKRHSDKAQLAHLQQGALAEFIEFRDSLSSKYGADMSVATFDDKTGLIHFPVDSVPETPSSP